MVHVAVDPLPARVQEAGAKEPELTGFVVKLTVVVGVSGELLVSVTVAVQVVAVLTRRDTGTQLTDVMVALNTVSVVLLEEDMCQSSPP